jgi:hypothetical protein
VQKSLTQAAIAADEAVSQQKKTIDVEQTNDLSVLVGIGCEIVLLLKFIFGLLCTMLVVSIYIVARLH